METSPLVVLVPEEEEEEEEEDERYEVVTNTPTAIAFSAIVRDPVDRTIWTVTLTNLVHDANYSIFITNTLENGFSIEGVTPRTNFNAEADGPFVFTLTSEEEALFWRATGKTTYITNTIPAN